MYLFCLYRTQIEIAHTGVVGSKYKYALFDHISY